MATEGVNGINGSAHKEVEATPERSIEAIALDPEAFKLLKMRLASEVDQEDVQKLRVFMTKAKAGRVHS